MKDKTYHKYFKFFEHGTEPFTTIVKEGDIPAEKQRDLAGKLMGWQGYYENSIEAKKYWTKETAIKDISEIQANALKLAVEIKKGRYSVSFQSTEYGYQHGLFPECVPDDVLTSLPLSELLCLDIEKHKVDVFDRVQNLQSELIWLAKHGERVKDNFRYGEFSTPKKVHNKSKIYNTRLAKSLVYYWTNCLERKDVLTKPNNSKPNTTKSKGLVSFAIAIIPIFSSHYGLGSLSDDSVYKLLVDAKSHFKNTK